MHMIDLRLRPERLVAHAQLHGHNHGQDEDLGYAVHGWLRDALGDHSPKTFRLIEQRDGALRLLGYASADAVTLRDHATRFASPAAVQACDWEFAASKSLGEVEWYPGQILGFEVRLCPVVRGKAGERDAFLARLPEHREQTGPSRTEVYRDWLAGRLNGAAKLDPEVFRLSSFRLVSTWRQGKSASEGKRHGRRMVRPDALVTGQLTIGDAGAFRDTLYRGIGRHRAFGFGMLLVRPA
jgi:CRISPR system Cascade subunit CasE